MPRDPPVTKATRPCSENRSFNIWSPLLFSRSVGRGVQRVKEASICPCERRNDETSFAYAASCFSTIAPLPSDFQFDSLARVCFLSISQYPDLKFRQRRARIHAGKVRAKGGTGIIALPAPSIFFEVRVRGWRL